MPVVLQGAELLGVRLACSECKKYVERSKL